MATGIELIISSICNATYCNTLHDSPVLEPKNIEARPSYVALEQELNGQHLKIATYTNYPISWTEQSDNGTLIGRGVAFIIVDILRKRFNFTFEVVQPERNYEAGGAKPEESIIGLVNSTIVDFAAVLIPTLSRFRQHVDFSTELDEGTWMMMVKRPKESATGSGLLAPFKNDVWYLVVAAVILYGPCITLLTRMRRKLVQDKESHIPLEPSFWFVYGAFIKQGTTLSPDSNTTRVLFATWWLFIILLSAFYTANLTAFLTLSKFTLDIESPQDLLKKNYRWVTTKGGAVEYTVKNTDDDLFYLNKMVINGRGEFRSVTNATDFLPMVTGGAVLIKEQVAIDHVMYDDYLNKARKGIAEVDRCTYVVAPKPFMKKLRAFVFPKQSKLKTLFDPVFHHLLQAGIIEFLQTRDLPSTKICPLDLQSKDRQLTNNDLLMTYLIMVTGLLAAAATFIGEIYFNRYLCVKPRRDDKSKKKKSRTKVRNTQDDSRPPPYDSLFGVNPKYRINEKSEKKIINGREYWVLDSTSGDTRLIPVRTPSAYLYR